MDEPWARVTPQDAPRLLAPLSIRWWIAGGSALDVRARRPHGDLDVVVLRPEHEAVRRDLHGWDVRIAYPGALRRWQAGPVGVPENAIWARPHAAGPWHIDF